MGKSLAQRTQEKIGPKRLTSGVKDHGKIEWSDEEVTAGWFPSKFFMRGSVEILHNQAYNLK